MAGVTSQAGAVPLEQGGPGGSAGLRPLAFSFIGGAHGQPAAGLALRLGREADGFFIVILDPCNAPLHALGPFPEEDVVAVWRSLGASSGLTLQIQLANGAVLTPYPQIGRVQLGRIRIRRRHGLLNGRRPRFLLRRKTGHFPLRPHVHREAEIVSGRET